MQNIMWGHPHCTSFLCPYTNQHNNRVNSSLTTTANHSLTPPFSVYFHEQRKDPWQAVLTSGNHPHQLCRPANGRAGWTASDRNKKRGRSDERHAYTPKEPAAGAVAHHQEPRLTADIKRLQRSVIRRPNQCTNDQWSATLESLDPEDQSLCRMTKWVMRVSTPSPPWSPQGESLSDS